MQDRLQNRLRTQCQDNSLGPVNLGSMDDELILEGAWKRGRVGESQFPGPAKALHLGRELPEVWEEEMSKSKKPRGVEAVSWNQAAVPQEEGRESTAEEKFERSRKRRVKAEPRRRRRKKGRGRRRRALLTCR